MINLLDIDSFSVNKYPEIVQKLHDKLLFKMFHSQANQDVIKWKKENKKKMLTKDKSKVAFREGLKHEAKKHEPPTKKPVNPSATKKLDAATKKPAATKSTSTTALKPANDEEVRRSNKVTGQNPKGEETRTKE